MTALPRLILFGREPVPGRVKTRLIPALGADGAARLYERLLEHALSAAAAMAGVEAELWCDTAGAEPSRCSILASRYGLTLYRQTEGDLGTRMYHALTAHPPAPGRPAVLIGSDCPGYNRDYLTRAFSALDHQEAVIGPALDGGYVLIGLNRVDSRLFDGIDWGTGTVLETTRSRLRDLGWRWTELSPQSDIDRPSDLGYLPSLSASPGG